MVLLKDIKISFRFNKRKSCHGLFANLQIKCKTIKMLKIYPYTNKSDLITMVHLRHTHRITFAITKTLNLYSEYYLC